MNIKVFLFIIVLSTIAIGQSGAPKPSPTPAPQTFDDIYGLKDSDLKNLKPSPRIFGDDLASRTRIAIKHKEYDAVLAEINGILAKDKKNAEALALRGDIYLAKKQTELARADYNQAIKLSPKTANYYYKRGMSYQEAPGYDLKTAAADNDKALQLDPTHSLALLEKGYNFNRDKKSAEAKAAFEAAVKSDPSNGIAYYQLGTIAISENNAPAALDALTRSIAADPTYIYSYGSRAEVYAFLKDYDRAADDFDKIVELEPNNEYGYGNRARFYAKIKMYDLAVADYTKILTFTTTPGGYIRDRGTAYELWGKYDEAIADYKNYIAKNSWDNVTLERANKLVDVTNAARATAKAMSEVFNPALEAYGLVEDDLGKKISSYKALRDSKMLVSVKGVHPLCAQIKTLNTLLTKAITAFNPIQQLYDQGKLKGFSEQLDFAEDRIRKINNTKKMFERDKKDHNCDPIYYVE